LDAKIGGQGGARGTKKRPGRGRRGEVIVRVANNDGSKSLPTRRSSSLLAKDDRKYELTLSIDHDLLILARAGAKKYD
jgi:hypothetical protein